MSSAYRENIEVIQSAINWYQDLIDKGINPESVEKMRNVVQKLFKITAGPYDDPVIDEEFYNEIKEALTAAKL